MQKVLKKIVGVVFSTNILVYSLIGLPLKAYADDIPNRADVRATIIQEAQSQSQQSLNTPSDTPAPSEQPTGEPTTANTDVTNTGDNTTINNSATSTDTTAVDSQNNSTVDQMVTANANTGHNEANGNISVNGGGAGVILTGDASVNVTGEVNAGNNTTGISGGNGGAGSGSDVVNSGDGLTVSSNSSATTYRIVRNRNTTIINQATDATANTGYNSAEGNISINGGPAGVIITGNASVTVNYLVTANGNVTIIGGTGENGSWDGASIILTNTGRAARFNNSANSTHLTTVTNDNRAVISQACGRQIKPEELTVDMNNGCSSNTGNNHADGQIAFGGDAGMIHTGDATVDVAMNAHANSNTTGISDGSGGTGANTDVLNTGNNVDVNNSANSNSTTTVGNSNDARVDQTVNAYANTGYNTANGNISFGGRAGWIQTGNATVNVLMSADVNNNATTVADGSASFDPRASTNGVDVVNTGKDVTINSSANNTTTIDVTNVNVLNLAQRVDAYTNTGNNNVDGNIGNVAGVIVTGNATTETNMNVNANTNCTLIGNTDATCPTNTPQPTQTPTNPPVGGTDVGSTNNPSGSSQGGIGGSSTSSSSSNSPASVAGQILGAVLPATGSEAGMMIVALSIAGILGGMKLRKIEN